MQLSKYTIEFIGRTYNKAKFNNFVTNNGSYQFPFNTDIDKEKCTKYLFIIMNNVSVLYLQFICRVYLHYIQCLGRAISVGLLYHSRLRLTSTENGPFSTNKPNKDDPPGPPCNQSNKGV